MAARPVGGARERRVAVWPTLLMPFVVLVVFCALHRIHHHPQLHAPPAASPPLSTAPGE